MVTQKWNFTGFEFSEMLFCLSITAWHTTLKLMTYNHFICSSFCSISLVHLYAFWLLLWVLMCVAAGIWNWVGAGVSWKAEWLGILSLFGCSLRISPLCVVFPHGVSRRVDRSFIWQFMAPHSTKVIAAGTPKGISSELALHNL